MDKLQQINAACEQGSLVGTTADGIFTFFDIPYAENSGRFKNANSPQNWEGTRDCTRPGPIFPQLPSRLDFVQGPYADGLEQSEDAFRLNIFTPSLDTKLPVLFWIHGGGFATGGGALKTYSGAALAGSGRVVVVTVNYRLGILGNLYLPGVSDGNYSVRDLETALLWVKRNIHNFGGDPDSIIVSGQSAGAWYTQLLIGMKSVSESICGAVILSSPAVKPLTIDEARSDADAFCALAGISDPARELPGLPVDLLLSTQVKLLVSKASFGTIAVPSYPLQNGTVPADLAEAALRFAPKPMIIGWTRDEAGAFLASDPRVLDTTDDQVLAKFKEFFGAGGSMRYQRSLKKRLPGTPYTAIVDLVTDKYFKRSSIRAAKMYSRAGGPVYTFQFDYLSPMPHVGACHCFDIPFWLGNFRDANDGPMLSGLNETEAGALSALMQNYLLNFLHTGNPNSENLPNWEHGNNGEIQTIHFDRYISCVAGEDIDY